MCSGRDPRHADYAVFANDQRWLFGLMLSEGRSVVHTIRRLAHRFDSSSGVRKIVIIRRPYDIAQISPAISPESRFAYTPRHSLDHLAHNPTSLIFSRKAISANGPTPFT